MDFDFRFTAATPAVYSGAGRIRRLWITAATSGGPCDRGPVSEFATVLGPATRLLWRAHDAVQIEMGSRRIVVDGVGAAAVRALIGRRGADAGADIAAPQAALIERGFLWPAPVSEDDEICHAPPVPRLAAELAALSVGHAARAGEMLEARAHYTVAIHGSGRLGPHVAALLAAAGVGRVHALEPAAVRLHQAAPGGLRPADEGSRFDEATAAAVLRAAPEADTTPPPLGDRPDLVVLAYDEPVDPDRRAALHSRDCAHLLIRLGADHGVVGPLVIPGLTSCLACADRHRRDRDPAWNSLAVQLSQPHRANAASSVAVTAVIAGLASLEALTFLDGGQPATIEATLEMAPPDIRTRRRSWPPHPDCDCMLG